MVDIPLNTTLFSGLGDAYIVGGSLRDCLLGKPVSDYDIVVPGNADTYAETLASKVQGRLVKIGKPRRDIIRIVTQRAVIDISEIHGQSIEEDLGKRDFTINAMAYRISTGEMIDVYGGMKDLKRKSIRMVSRETFANDPIRLLRAHRMAASIGFEITPETAARIQKDAPRIRHSAGERIREEILKIVKTKRSHAQICQMVENGLLFALIQELRGLKGCTQNRYHTQDVLAHTLSAYGFLEQSLNSLDRDFPEWSDRLDQRLRGNNGTLLKWAMLLHDIGKPDARTEDANGQVHFYRHSQNSAQIAQKVNDDMRFSKLETHYVDTIIRHHTRPLSLYIARENQTLTQKGIIRFFIQCGDDTPDILVHGLADMRGKGRENRIRAYADFTQEILTDFYSDFQPKAKDSPLLTGHDLICELGLSPSPMFKAILNEVEAARLEGRIQDKTTALRHAKRILSTIIDDTSS